MVKFFPSTPTQPAAVPLQFRTSTYPIQTSQSNTCTLSTPKRRKTTKKLPLAGHESQASVTCVCPDWSLNPGPMSDPQSTIESCCIAGTHPFDAPPLAHWTAKGRISTAGFGTAYGRGHTHAPHPNVVGSIYPCRQSYLIHFPLALTSFPHPTFVPPPTAVHHAGDRHHSP